METKSALKWACFNGSIAVVGGIVGIIVLDRLTRDIYSKSSFVEDVGIGGSVLLAATFFVIVATTSFVRILRGIDSN